MRFESGQHIHFVGIGGFGISAIARVLLEQGYRVSGSDRNQNQLTGALARDGATVFHGHDAAYVDGADMLIISSAVPADHVEVQAAQARGIPVYKRRDILSALMEGRRVVAVSGTHGKTTTTSMIVHALKSTGHDPGYIVGGIMATTGTNAAVGLGEWFVIEADEYDHMFLGLRPDMIVLTSMEYDHPDFFPSWIEMRDAFRAFLDLLARDGTLIVCGDDAGAEQLLQEQCEAARGKSFTEGQQRTLISYGTDMADFVDVIGWDYRIGEDGYSEFSLELNFPLVGSLAMVRMPVVGKHNVLNALAAIIAVNHCVPDVPVSDVVRSLETFQTTGRRFEVRGEVNGVVLIDDYAHHPTAIRYMLEAVKLRYPVAAIWAIWQPHMYSRTQKLLTDYASAFTLADHVIVTDIYAAREAPIPGVDGATVAAALDHGDARHISGFETIVDTLIENVHGPAVVIVMSAGDATRINELYLKRVEQ
jgi:UDP-N-acetylmuramate--alanine ligase